MKIVKDIMKVKGIRLSAREKNEEVGFAFIYLMKNDAHKRPFGLIEYVFVKEKFRGQGIGTKLVRELVATAKKEKCYKVIMTSRYSRENVHRLYQRLGFKDWGKEFRVDFK